MTEKRLSEFATETSLQATDLLLISQDDGVGGYVTKNVTAETVKNYTQGNSYKEVKIFFKQLSTSTPSISGIIDDFGLTLTASRLGVGDYTVSGYASNIAGNYEIYVNTNMITGSAQLVTKVTSTSTIEIKTYNAGVLTDGIAGVDGITITLKVY